MAKRGSLSAIPSYRPGMTTLSAEHLETQLQHHRELDALHQLELQRPPREEWLGITVADAYTDERYLVERAYISNTDSDSASAITVVAYSGGDPYYRQVTASNLGEQFAGSHTLPVGTPVWVFKSYDSSSPKVERYFFTRKPGWQTADFKVSIQDGTPPESCPWGIFYTTNFAYEAEVRALFHFPTPIRMRDLETCMLRALGSSGGAIQGRLRAYLTVDRNIDIYHACRMSFATDDFSEAVTWATQPQTLSSHSVSGMGCQNGVAGTASNKEFRIYENHLLAYHAPAPPADSTTIYGVMLSQVIVRYTDPAFFNYCRSYIPDYLADLTCTLKVR